MIVVVAVNKKKKANNCECKHRKNNKAQNIKENY